MKEHRMNVPQPPIAQPPIAQPPIAQGPMGPPPGFPATVPSGPATGSFLAPAGAPRRGVTKVAVAVVTMGAVLAGGGYAYGLTPTPEVALSSAEKAAVPVGDDRVFDAAPAPAEVAPVEPAVQPATEPVILPEPVILSQPVIQPKPVAVPPARKPVRRAPVVVSGRSAKQGKPGKHASDKSGHDKSDRDSYDHGDRNDDHDRNGHGDRNDDHRPDEQDKHKDGNDEKHSDGDHGDSSGDGKD